MMNRSLGFVAGASKACCNARPWDRHGHSHGCALSEWQCADTQTRVDAAASLREFALNDRESEDALKQATVSDEGDNSRRSLVTSTAVFVQDGSAIREINISGNQVLVALAVAFCLAGPILWAFVRYWLFAL